MVDMANSIDFRLRHCNGKFHALRYKIIKLFNFLWFQSKPETSKAHRNNSKNIVTREKRPYFASK